MTTTEPTLLYVNGIERRFMSLYFEKRHPNPDPDTVDFRLTPEEAEGIKNFDVIEIRKNGIVEFHGFVEEITPEVGEDGLEYLIEGRCWKLIVWKKWTDRYQESREIGPKNTEGILESGFFGAVYPDELIKFIMRSPRSIHPRGYIRHKIGWGIPSDRWDCCANVTADCYYPEWVALRYTGLAWRNRGGVDETNTYELDVDGFDSSFTQWLEWGVSPYLDSDNRDNAILTNWVDDITEGDFSFEDLPAAAGVIMKVVLHVEYLGEVTEKVRARLSYDGFTTYYEFILDWGDFSGVDQEFDVTEILDTKTKINNAEIRFYVRPEGDPIYMLIWHSYLEVVAGSSSGVYQGVGDYFIVDMGRKYDDVAAILIECRNSPTLYARNYNLKYTDLSGAPAYISNCCCDEVTGNESYWKDFTPSIDVVNNHARDILHSWEPEDDVRCIRIMITGSANVAWEISQIYIWQSDSHKYRMMDEGD